MSIVAQCSGAVDNESVFTGGVDVPDMYLRSRSIVAAPGGKPRDTKGGEEGRKGGSNVKLTELREAPGVMCVSTKRPG